MKCDQKIRQRPTMPSLIKNYKRIDFLIDEIDRLSKIEGTDLSVISHMMQEIELLYAEIARLESGEEYVYEVC